MTNPIPTSDARLELLVWSECPSHQRAEEMLRTAIAEAGRPDEAFTVRWIESHNEAEVERFVGSPTFRLDGIDLVEAGEGYALTCRVYQRDGRPAPLPSQADLTDWVRHGLS